MKPIKFALMAALALSSVIAVNAKPAKPGDKTITQPDGTTLTIHFVGNAFNHYILTDDEKVLVKDSDGQYSYATLDADGALISTGVQAHNAASRPDAEFAIALDIADAGSQTDTSAGVRRRATAQTGVGLFETGFPNEGTIRGIAILVNFTDESFKDDSYYDTNAHDYFKNMINQSGFNESKGTGSAKDYFSDMSGGRFQLDFDVVGPYNLAKNYSYYGKDDRWGWDQHADEMVAEACKLADDDVNFADYDNDGDGYCDFVYVIYAGAGASDGVDADRIWPHSYFLSYTKKQVTLDGVVVDKYACSNEWETSVPDGVGTFVHEFSHVMGLPDLYDSTGSHYCTPGYYSVLDVGCYNNNSRTPVAFGAYERNAMDWIDLKVISENETITLHNIIDANEACIIKTQRDDEFFLFENRQLTSWDASIPNHGMLIWHIDGEQEVYDKNTVNDDKNYMHVAIVKANNKASYSRTAYTKGWPWPGTSNSTTFSSKTTPALIDWENNTYDIVISDIAESDDGIITFNVTNNSDGVNDITVNTDTEATEYFNLQGIRVANPQNGIFIVRNGNSATVKKL